MLSSNIEETWLPIWTLRDLLLRAVHKPRVLHFQLSWSQHTSSWCSCSIDVWRLSDGQWLWHPLWLSWFWQHTGKGPGWQGVLEPVSQSTWSEWGWEPERQSLRLLGTETMTAVLRQVQKVGPIILEFIRQLQLFFKKKWFCNQNSLYRPLCSLPVTMYIHLISSGHTAGQIIQLFLFIPKAFITQYE